MNIYLAPMEGLTGNIYRAVFNKHFGGVDKFFTPFLPVAEKGALSTKGYRDVLPENNAGMKLVPQILSNSAEGFLVMCDRLAADFGYDEFNINLGCPSGTVVSKGRGAGFLAYPEELDRFLDGIYKSRYKISVKTRIGMAQPEEFVRLISIYEKYPVHELIIHPRTGKDKYKNTPNWDMYAYAVQNSRHRLCYNGDIFTLEDMEKFKAAFPMADTVMLGRGVIADPALPALIKGGKLPDRQQLTDFFAELCDEYAKVLSGSTNLLHKMKEVALYLSWRFEGCEKTVKRIKKAKNIDDFKAAVFDMVLNGEMTV
ncbi:MAG: tRNA-dihydrouridine synthase family protein [Firmicutes bacterium]|nr:tRNA-dihydrouridine synthase family protein [Bacillota bacterium]